MKKFLKITVMLMFAAAAYPSVAVAQSIAVTPDNGASMLDFGSPQNGEAVTKILNTRVGNATGQPYQVFHEIVEDVVNEQGVVLPASAFKFHTVFGSNTYGTLYELNETSVPQVETLIYDSNSEGIGDIFKVSYTLYSSQVQQNGNYQGRIRYTFRTDDGAFEVVDEIDVAVTIQAVPEMSLESSGSGDAGAQFNPLNPTENAGFVKINFDKNSCNNMQIIQSPESLPTNSAGKSLKKGSILFSVSSPKGESPEVLVEGKQALEPKEIPIFQPASSSGSAIVHFFFNPESMKSETAGDFKALIKFLVVCDGVIVGDLDFFFGFVLDDIFKLTVTHVCNPSNDACQTAAGEYILGKDMKPGEASQDDFIVKIETNQSFNYIVTQELPSKLTHENGNDTVPESALIESSQLEVGSAGCSAFEPGGLYFFPASPDNFVVPIGNEVNFFVSDNEVGRCILATFTLQAPAGMRPGDYFAPFYYTLTPN